MSAPPITYPLLSVTCQPLDGAPAVVHVLHFLFHSSSLGCLQSTTLPLSLRGPVDCNFGKGVDTLAQHMPNPAPSLAGDDGLHASAMIRGHGWRWFLARRYIGLS